MPSRERGIVARLMESLAGRRRRAMLLAAAIAIGAPGCATFVPAAPSWLPGRKQVAGSPFGAFAAVRVEGRREDPAVAGELISVESDSIYVLTESGLVAVANERVTHLGIRDHAPPGGLREFSPNTLTRGVGREAFRRVRSSARYPQGLPPGLDRSSLRPRPTP